MYLNFSAIQFLTCGGGSKAWRGVVNWWKPEEMKFYYDGQGVMSVKVTETEIDIVFYDVYGHVLHKWNTSKQLHASWWTSSRSNPRHLIMKQEKKEKINLGDKKQKCIQDRKKQLSPIISPSGLASYFTLCNWLKSVV